MSLEGSRYLQGIGCTLFHDWVYSGKSCSLSLSHRFLESRGHSLPLATVVLKKTKLLTTLSVSAGWLLDFVSVMGYLQDRQLECAWCLQARKRVMFLSPRCL
jgi:hypothetical protein